MFKMNRYVHDDLKISNERDIELENITTYIANKIQNESEFLLILEKRDDLSLIEKLYIAAQFGRLYRGEIKKGEI